MIDVQDPKIRRNWQRCSRDVRDNRWSTLYASMYPSGDIVISRHTHDALGSPDAYVLLFEPNHQVIGLQPAQKHVKDAYPAQPRGRHGGRRLRGYRLMRDFGVCLTETVRFPRCVIDHSGTLVLDLRDTVVAVKKRRKEKIGVTGSEYLRSLRK